MRISQNEIDILRQLGEKYMKYASLSVQREKMNMWKALNRCKPERPMFAIDQLPWHELEALAPGQLKCQIADSYWSEIERWLRRLIFQWENFPLDTVVEPFIKIPSAITNTGYGLTIDEEVLIKSAENETASSHRYNNQFKDFSDIEKIKDIKFTHDKERSAANLQEAEYIFQGIAHVSLSHNTVRNLGVWDYLSQLMGVEAIYYDLVDRPDFLHALVRRLTDAFLSGIKSINELEIANDNESLCHCSYVYTDELLPDFGAGKGSVTKNAWGYGLAQLFTSVSPDFSEEFELPYITEMANEFGAIYYGCCERLDDRLDFVKKIPNIRKVSCSPWSDIDNFTRNLGQNLILSAKPNPAYLSGGFNENAVRDEIKHYLNAAKENNVSVELILKDVSTITNDLSALKKWNDIAMKLVENY